MDLWDERWSHELVVLTAQRRPRQQGVSFVPLHSDLPRPPCLWEPDQKNVGRRERARGGRPRSWPEESWHSPAANILTSSWAHVHQALLLASFRLYRGKQEVLLQISVSLREGRVLLLQASGRLFSCVCGEEVATWTLLWERDDQSWNSGGKGECSLRSSSAQTQADRFRMKLSASWEGPVVSKQRCTRSSRWALNLFGTFIGFATTFFKKIFEALNEMAIRPERVHPWRRVVRFSVRDLTVSAPLCSAGSQAPSACPVPSAEEVPRQTGSSSS